MGCWGSVSELTQKELADLRTGNCPGCGSDIDEDGKSVEMDNCSYSPVICTLCGWRPCDDSC